MPYYRPPWIAKVMLNGKQIWLGAFETKEEAYAVEDAFRDCHNLPKTRKEIAALAHTTLSITGNYRNQHTVSKK